MPKFDFSFTIFPTKPNIFIESLGWKIKQSLFNTFNNKNNLDPSIGSSLFDFSGFLRQGVGDPRQVQLAIRFTF